MDSPKKVVLLLSGGLDSNLCLAELLAKPIEEVERVLCVIIDYGQSSLQEMECAIALCEAWKVPYIIVKLSEWTVGSDTRNEIPARNLTFIAYAASIAIQNHFNTVAVGFEPDSTYTDSSVEFAERVSHLLNLFDIELITPVKHYANKLHLVTRALDLGVPLHLCHSSRSNTVDGKCKTSKLFLDAIRVLFPLEQDPTAILKQLSGLVCDYHSVKNTYQIKYVIDDKPHSFKYAAALFAITSKTIWNRTIKVFSTGSWSHDLESVTERYNLKDHFLFQKTSDLSLMKGQEVNTEHWGLKQSLSLLPRARYLKCVSCQSMQGRLAAALYDLGYVPTTPSVEIPHLDTASWSEERC